MIYLDNAATSWPKPGDVYETADRVFREFSGNPGRSGHRLSLAAGRYIEETRGLLGRLFNVPPETLCFTLNATDALNLALKGLLKPGDHVVTGSMEHNAVARPLEALRQRGISCAKIPVSPIDGADPEEVRAALTRRTRLVVFSHVSNVTGTENPIAEISRICREEGVLFLVDAAQSAGSLPLDLQALGVDLLAFPGHKGLLGPQGTGGLYIRPGLILQPLREGGAGSRSEDLNPPPAGPDRYESGTQNTAGLAALGEGVRWLLAQGLEVVARREALLASRLLEGLEGIPGLTLYGPPAGERRRGVVSINLEGMDCAQGGIILDNAFDIAVRSGLHCAPDAHRTLGTLAVGGTLRISLGSLTTEADIDACLDALSRLSR
ncbi:MAG: aminotransferase class V-fold PLP-dependent enzyme [Spirochaetales bacterium]|nr:aminotransferase class V-fold PLP-dependent enzyme [Spirochaetales bacterium]